MSLIQRFYTDFRNGITPGSAAAKTEPKIGEIVKFIERSSASSAGSWVADPNPMAELQPGVWLVFAQATWAGNNTANHCAFSISTNSTSDASDRLNSTSYVNMQNSNAANSAGVPGMPAYFVATRPTKLYAKTYAEDQTGLNQFVSGFAIRIG